MSADPAKQKGHPMTALSPVPNATGSIPLVSTDAAPSRRVRIRELDGTPPAWAQLGAAVASTSIIWVAVAVALSGYVLAAVPVAVLALVIFGAAVLPDLLTLRWDRIRAEQDACEFGTCGHIACRPSDAEDAA